MTRQGCLPGQRFCLVQRLICGGGIARDDFDLR
jgi:hypothetical protein